MGCRRRTRVDEVGRQCGVVVVGVGWGQAPALHSLPRLSVVNSRFGKFRVLEGTRKVDGRAYSGTKVFDSNLVLLSDDRLIATHGPAIFEQTEPAGKIGQASDVVGRDEVVNKGKGGLHASGQGFIAFET